MTICEITLKQHIQYYIHYLEWSVSLKFRMSIFSHLTLVVFNNARTFNQNHTDMLLLKCINTYNSMHLSLVSVTRSA